MPGPIQIKGIDVLSVQEKLRANQLINEYYLKIQRMLKNITSIFVDFKEYEKAGKESKRKKYSIHVKVMAPTQMFEADAADWDFARTIHKVMNKVKNEIEKKLRVSEQRG